MIERKYHQDPSTFALLKKHGVSISLAPSAQDRVVVTYENRGLSDKLKQSRAARQAVDRSKQIKALGVEDAL